ncbi:unnamed protein product [marine sediment metagenome]|uniref:Uncharacterized protein n=1 Tax=marine sediment metagenome TaxID=412755 RepID=X1STS3_9ZZZZ
MDYKKVEDDIVDIILRHQVLKRLGKYKNIAQIIANDVANYIKALIEKDNK